MAPRYRETARQVADRLGLTVGQVEYARRKAAGAERGERPSDAAGHRARSATSKRRAPFEDTVQVGRRKVTVIQSTDRKRIMRRIRQAAKKKHNTVIYAVWQDDDGGYSTQVLGGRQSTHADSRGRDRATGKMRIVIGTPETMRALFPGASGVPAQQVVDAMKARSTTGEPVYDSLDDYLADWWDDAEGDEGMYGQTAAATAPPAGYGTSPRLAAATAALASAGDLGDF